MVNPSRQTAELEEMSATAHALHEGDDIVAGSDAVAEVQHFDGSLTRLDAGATAALGRIADPDGRAHVVLHLGPGASWHRTSPTKARGGQYEAQTPGASVLARSAAFVVRADDRGGAWVAVLSGTAIVRGCEGGMVVLRAGETVAASPTGALGEVSDLGPSVLAEDEWVEVNRVLDEEPDPPQPGADPPVDVFVVTADPAPALAASPAHIGGPRPADREHPWRVGVAATVAMALAGFSVFIGRTGPSPSTPPEGDAGAVVPGPPAYATPAVPAVPTDAPAPASAPADSEPDATTGTEAAAPGRVPEPGVTGKSCTRAAGGVVVYNGSLHNHASGTASYRVHVTFVDARGETVATTSADVADVPAGGTRSFRVPASAGRAATACEVDRVEPIA